MVRYDTKGPILCKNGSSNFRVDRYKMGETASYLQVALFAAHESVYNGTPVYLNPSS